MTMGHETPGHSGAGLPDITYGIHGAVQEGHLNSSRSTAVSAGLMAQQMLLVAL